MPKYLITSARNIDGMDHQQIFDDKGRQIIVIVGDGTLATYNLILKALSKSPVRPTDISEASLLAGEPDLQAFYTKQQDFIKKNDSDGITLEDAKFLSLCFEYRHNFSLRLRSELPKTHLPESYTEWTHRSSSAANTMPLVAYNKRHRLEWYLLPAPPLDAQSSTDGSPRSNTSGSSPREEPLKRRRVDSTASNGYHHLDLDAPTPPSSPRVWTSSFPTSSQSQRKV